MTKVICNLCQQEFNENDPFILIRKDRHEKFHANAWRDKRNTTNGIVIWRC